MALRFIPYFSKREQEVKISVPAASVMEMTEEKIPTGKLIPAGETVPDLRTPVLVDGLSLDHVYRLPGWSVCGDFL